MSELLLSFDDPELCHPGSPVYVCHQLYNYSVLREQAHVMRKLYMDPAVGALFDIMVNVNGVYNVAYGRGTRISLFRRDGQAQTEMLLDERAVGTRDEIQMVARNTSNQSLRFSASLLIATTALVGAEKERDAFASQLESWKLKFGEVVEAKGKIRDDAREIITELGDKNIELRQALTDLHQEYEYVKSDDFVREHVICDIGMGRITKLDMLSDGSTVLDFQKRWNTKR